MPFDEAKALRVKRFIEGLAHTKGRFANTKFKLADWQWNDIVKPLYGTINDDGSRQYRTALIMLPRKNGKTELCAALALYHLFADQEAGGEIYSAAVDREQASLCFNVAAQMVRQNPQLSSRCKIIDSQKRIVVPKTGSFYRAIPAVAASSHGYNASAIIYDEMHAATSRDLYDVLSTSTGARHQPIMIIISTAGYDTNSILYEQYEYANRIKGGVVEDRTFLPVVYEATELDDWTQEDTWRSANPALGDFRNIHEMSALCKKAQEVPALENTFRRLYLNQWTRSETRWLPLDRWDACSDHINYGDPDQQDKYISGLLGRKCYAGLDLSSTTDISALVLVFPDDDDEVYTILPYFWVPQENMLERVKRDKVPYDLWVKQGLITATPGNVIDYGYILNEIEACAIRFDLKELAFDRWGATKIIQELQDMGFENEDSKFADKRLIQFGQGYKSISPPLKEFETMILGRKIIHGNNPVLRFMADSAIVVSDPADNKKFDKAKSTGRIDGLVATVMALDRALKHKRVQESIYTKRIAEGSESVLRRL